LRRENEWADVLAENGYDVEQNPPPKPNGKKPDYRIEGEYFGFDQRFTATFRFSSLADQPTAEHGTALMVHTLIAFASQYEGRGVLLFNGETAVLQYADGAVVLDAEWEEWPDNSEVAPLLNQFTTRVLPQPLL
jgi:hypothetical protein